MNLVDDLRAPCDYCKPCPGCRLIMQEAAEDIERLLLLESQAIQSRIKSGKFTRLAEAKLSRQLLEAKQEIDRLREQLQNSELRSTSFLEIIRDHEGLAERYKSEIERLRAEVALLRGHVDPLWKYDSGTISTQRRINEAARAVGWDDE